MLCILHLHREPESPQFGRELLCAFSADDQATAGAHGPLGSVRVKYGLSGGQQIVNEQVVEMERPRDSSSIDLGQIEFPIRGG